MNAVPRGSKARSVAGPAGAAAVLCAACCVGPVLSVLAAVGIGSAIGALWLPMLVMVALAAGLAALWVQRSARSHALGCGSDHGRVVDLEMPTTPPQDAVHHPR